MKMLLLEDSHVLVADGDAVSRRFTAQGVDDGGAVKVLTATENTEALALMRANRVDWLILDVSARTAEGLSLLKALRTGKLGLARDLPVVILAAADDQFTQEVASALDCQGTLPKPQSADEMREALLECEGRSVDLKDEQTYDRVRLRPLEPLGLLDAETPAHAEASEAETEPSIPIEQIPEGAVLMEDIISTGEGTLVAAGATVTAAIKGRLWELSATVLTKQARVRLPPAEEETEE